MDEKQPFKDSEPFPLQGMTPEEAIQWAFGTKPAFSPGDRVRVVDEYFVEHLRGAIGTITTPEPSVRSHVRQGDYWVEFDELQPNENGQLTEAGAISGADLRPI
jgi:hypothetical protein